MGIEDIQPEKGPLEIIQYEIDNARALIDAEFERSTGNSWLVCVNTRLTVLFGQVEFAKEDGLISEEQEQEMQSKLKAILTRNRELMAQYRGQKDVPEEVKKELISSLDILK